MSGWVALLMGALNLGASFRPGVGPSAAAGFYAAGQAWVAASFVLGAA